MGKARSKPSQRWPMMLKLCGFRIQLSCLPVFCRALCGNSDGLKVVQSHFRQADIGPERYTLQGLVMGR